MSKFIVEPRKAGMTKIQRAERQEFMSAAPPTRFPKKWMDRTEAAVVLGVSTRTIDRLRRDGSLGYCRGPMFGFAAAIRFWAEDVHGRKELHP